MSLRAIKKRENLQPPSSITNSALTRTSLFRKLNKTKTNQQQASVGNSSLQFANQQKHITSPGGVLKQQYKLLGRLTRSNPEFGEPSDTLKRLEAASLVRTKSEGDVKKLLSCQNQSDQGALLNAKSEICLKTISTHSCPGTTANSNHKLMSQPQTVHRKTSKHSSNMSRSHRDLTQSAYASSAHNHNVEVSHCHVGTGGQRRMSEGNYMRSQRTSSMSTSELTSSSIGASSLGHSVPPVDPNSILRIPIIGYEVMEERARFTVYKLRVENPHTNDCWLVLRRYTDFVRLNTKLKQAFPHLILNLPRKKIFGDNFNSAFLDNRIQGLQMFVNSIMSKDELRKCQLVREFFCLDEPPSYSESMEECRAIFEAQEETISHLKMQVNNKNDLILQLQQKLRDELQEKEQLKEMLKNLNLNPSNGKS